MNSLKTVFLVSGGGGNMRFVCELAKEYNIEVCGAVGDRHCSALTYASKIYKIETFTQSFQRTSNENGKLISILNSFDADVIVTNVHKIISASVLEKVSSKFINLHYSYLPAYQGYIGMRPLLEAIHRGNKFAGVTCHEVTENLDAGNTIAQAVFPIYNSNKSKNIQQCFEAGALTLLAGLQYLQKENHASHTLLYDEIVISPGFNMLSKTRIEEIFNILKL